MSAEIIKINARTKRAFEAFINGVGLNEEGNYLDTYANVFLYVQDGVPVYYFAVHPEGGYIAPLIDDEIRNESYINLLIDIDDVITGGENIDTIISIER